MRRKKKKNLKKNEGMPPEATKEAIYNGRTG